MPATPITALPIPATSNPRAVGQAYGAAAGSRYAAPIVSSPRAIGIASARLPTRCRLIATPAMPPAPMSAE
jgi:hypothetical protein